jgi:hypothetical protein
MVLVEDFGIDHDDPDDPDVHDLATRAFSGEHHLEISPHNGNTWDGSLNGRYGPHHS